jgi:AhpD family alkylhydroperoxidase
MKINSEKRLRGVYKVSGDSLALGIASHCDGCIGFHTQALARLGATQEEVVETLSMAVYMGGGPSLMYAAETLTAFEQAKIA